ncbi:cation diffusion facilitator family transporter [Kiritimatiella glycovorans]|uniref:Cation efflux system protein CzcD n=1 Tax=Kiritimatiella glycovorans TaxID=1307763 RepID=A0A0G3EMA1_9BACT|nr:cation diffusion facilitator family transporter [Kiritimatiella glycovorans]AKJ65284.1 Cation efflux system protein CzcD [Kiritimatiella glycovorans]
MTEHRHHSHHHEHAHDRESGIGVAFFLNAGFTVLEIAGGLWTNSMAILADAVHDLGDSFALASAWYFERLSGRGRDRYYSYGYRRFSLLGALISTIVLIAGGMAVLWRAVPRLLNPEPVHAEGMIAFAVLGVIVNGLAALRLRRQKGMNARVVLLHLLEDVLGWIAVLLTAVVLVFRDIPVLDAGLSILITIWVLRRVWINFRRILQVFLQGTPEHLDPVAIESELTGIEGVRSLHHVHLWSMDGVRHIFTAHVVIDPSFKGERRRGIREEAREILDRYEIFHSTLELEPGDEPCGMEDVPCGSPRK